MLLPLGDAASQHAHPVDRPHKEIQSCADRLAVLILSVVPLAADARTLQGWAKAAHVSVGSLRGYCCTAGVPAKQALDFARLLRVVLRSGRGAWEPTRWLSVSDPRHLRRLLARGDLVQSTGAAPLTPRTYLARQRLIPSQSAVLSCVATRLKGRRAG